MKVNELSELSGVNIETIRMYRNKGLLHPKRLDNGYYDYSISQLNELLNIKKLRASALSLDAIDYYCSRDDKQEIVDALNEEYEELKKKIEDMKRQLYMLQVTMQHFKLYRDNPDKVLELDVEEDSYSLVIGDSPDEDTKAWFNAMTLMTQSILIPPQTLLDPDPPDTIHFDIGVGTYKQILDSNGIKIPERAVRIPKGKFLTAWVTTDGGREMSRMEIQPILSYAAKKHYTLTGEATAFLYRVDTTEGEPKFIYRFRARVK